MVPVFRAISVAASLAITLAASPVLAQLPSEERVPGGIALIPLKDPTAEYTFEGRKVLQIIRSSDKTAVAVVGLGLDASPGTAVLKSSDGRAIEFEIRPKQYREQHLRVPASKVNLSPEDLARHNKERTHIAKVIEGASASPPTTIQMIAPTPGRISAGFGLRRYFNGEPRSPHNGIDIAAPTGTPVVAPLAGRVIDTGDYFFAGLTVWIDHGGGLLSMVCHLSRIDVKVGDSLQQGQPLGLVGATGRATGPHLHWSVNLNGQMVNPVLFMTGKQR